MRSATQRSSRLFAITFLVLLPERLLRTTDQTPDGNRIHSERGGNLLVAEALAAQHENFAVAARQPPEHRAYALLLRIQRVQLLRRPRPLPGHAEQTLEAAATLATSQFVQRPSDGGP